ncbi:MAG: NAD(P)H-dependent oxidoreductase [Pseudomonadota bacterium]
MSNSILRVDASMRKQGSVGRNLADTLIAKLASEGATVTERDLLNGVSFVNENWIGANFTDESERTDLQKDALSESDALIAELEAANVLVIATPIYNFGVPAAFKAWIDMVTRARKTFRYGDNGPEGLLKGKKAYVVITSGGTALDSDIDFVSPWINHILAFIGITDVTLINASALMMDEAAALARANAQIDSI